MVINVHYKLLANKHGVRFRLAIWI